jgi:hypothetical protein
MSPIILALINLLETFIANNESAWIADFIAEIESFLPKAKAHLAKKLEAEKLP